MPRITAARAIANNEIAIVAWWLDAAIPNCVGFELTRVYADGSPDRVLPAWVPFKRQTNTAWLPQTTSVWPIQKLYWRDLTLRKQRDTLARHPEDISVKYRIRALVPSGAGLPAIPVAPNAPAYSGAPFPLAYANVPAVETNLVKVTLSHGNVEAAFTNGMLSGQWLNHVIAPGGGTPQNMTNAVMDHIKQPGDPIRAYLAGDVSGVVRSLLDRAAQSGGKVYLALYELTDPELIPILVANAKRIELILSNTSKNKQGQWDTENAPARTLLHKTPGLVIHDRFFNNDHIGHNKFAVLVDANNTGVAVMTGSTNWTYTGLCGQSNNAIIVESPALADAYVAYWQRILADTTAPGFITPKPTSKPTSNKQGAPMRTADAKPIADIVLADGTRITPWFSPNTKAATYNRQQPVTPPDLAVVQQLMQQATDAILFAVFLPSQLGVNSVVSMAIAAGVKKASLLVYGAVSDPAVMPNYIKSGPLGPTGKVPDKAVPKPGTKPVQPTTYDNGNIHIVRATALTVNDITGAFEAELLKVGIAIIHDKIVVVDPFSPSGFVAMGSHNMGFKAAYGNDENLLIIRNNPSLIQAYAAHVLDVYDHYRFRAVQQAAVQSGQPAFSGFLQPDASWFSESSDTAVGGLAHYLSGAPATAAIAGVPTTAATPTKAAKQPTKAKRTKKKAAKSSHRATKKAAKKVAKKPAKKAGKKRGRSSSGRRKR